MLLNDFELIYFISDDNRVLIANKGGIEMMLQAMKFHPNHADVQENACGALHNLALNGKHCCVVFLT